jgi:O-antigen/teichoic acid export membrane protein
MSQMPLDAAYRRRTVAANFLAVSIASGLTVLIGIFATAYSRRVLGPAAVGLVNWNAAALTYLALLASPALQIIGQRDIASDPRQTAPITSLVLSLQFLLAIVAYAATLVLAFASLRGADASALLVLQGLSLIVSAGTVTWVLQAHQRMVAPSIASLAVNLLQVPALIALVRQPDDVYVFVLYTLPFSLAVVVFNFWYLQHLGLLRVGELRPRLAGTTAFLSQAWPLALSQGAGLLIYNCGAIILGFTHSDEEVGFYTTAYRLMFMSTVLSGAMLTAYFPVLARVHHDPPQAARVSGEFATLMAWMGLPIAALGWACGRHVNDLLFGAQFAASGPYFEWLCLAIGLVFVNIGLGTPLLAWGYQRLHLKIAATAATLSVVLSLVLIPRHGGWGAVAAILTAEGSVLAMIMVARWRLGVGRHSLAAVLLAPSLCSLAVALAIVALPRAAAAYWWLELAIGAVVLLVCVCVFERRIVSAARGLLRRAA